MADSTLLSTATVNDVSSVAELAGQALAPVKLEPGAVYAVADGEGKVKRLDTDDVAEAPRRAEAWCKVLDAASFVAYIQKHGLDQTEVWADQLSNTVIGIIDAHQGANRPAGWGKHRVQLRLEHTKSWLAWTQGNELLFKQTEFAEFIDLRANDVHEPSAAELVTIARHFSATKSAEFESSNREADGQIRFAYKETVSARAGQKGDLSIPEQFRLALRPYIGGPVYWVIAKLRYRLTGGELRIGYVLERPEEILESAFTDIVTEIRDGKADGRVEGDTAEKPQQAVKPGHGGITQPIFAGRPA